MRFGVSFHSKIEGSLTIVLLGKYLVAFFKCGAQGVTGNVRVFHSSQSKKNSIFQGKVAGAMKFDVPQIGLLHRNCLHDIWGQYECVSNCKIGGRSGIGKPIFWGEPIQR